MYLPTHVITCVGTRPLSFALIELRDLSNIATYESYAKIDKLPKENTKRLRYVVERKVCLITKEQKPVDTHSHLRMSKCARTRFLVHSMDHCRF